MNYELMTQAQRDAKREECRLFSTMGGKVYLMSNTYRYTFVKDNRLAVTKSHGYIVIDTYYRGKLIEK